jgi:adenylyl- and sulfurtransferase ThiI
MAGFVNFTTEKHEGKIVIRGITDTALAARTIARIFGVAYACPATRIPCSMESIMSEIVSTASETMSSGQSFAIRCHRSSRNSISTQEVARKGGSEVLNKLVGKNVRVNLSAPDVAISVDLSEKNAFVYTSKQRGPGGLPLSSQWKMLAILDSGPLSLFAAYVMMRRGCLAQLLIPVHGTDDSSALSKQLRLARKLRSFVTRENYPAFIIELAFGDISKQIARMLALEIAKEHHFRGIILADIVGQIAFHKRLAERSLELGVPVFQPLIGFDRDDLMNLGRVFDIEQPEIEAALPLGFDLSSESSIVSTADFRVREVSI